MKGYLHDRVLAMEIRDLHDAENVLMEARLLHGSTAQKSAIKIEMHDDLVRALGFTVGEVRRMDMAVAMMRETSMEQLRGEFKSMLREEIDDAVRKYDNLRMAVEEFRKNLTTRLDAESNRHIWDRNTDERTFSGVIDKMLIACSTPASF